MAHRPASPLPALARRPGRAGRRARVAVLLLALASLWTQWAWHLPMALANAGNPALAAVACGGPLDAADIAQLVEQGLLPAGSDGNGEHTLCDLLTSPPAGPATLATVSTPPPPAVAPATRIRAAAPAAPLTRLPPARAPPVA